MGQVLRDTSSDKIQPLVYCFDNYSVLELEIRFKRKLETEALKNVRT